MTKKLEKMTMQEVDEAIRSCELCPLYSTRTKAITSRIFSYNSLKKMKVLIVGEAPGFNEDQQGEPFVGKSGQLLDTVICGSDLMKYSVAITNVVKCRPPSNRYPKDDEVQKCRPYLLRQIELIQPNIMIALGKLAARVLRDSPYPNSMGIMVNRVHPGLNKIPVVVAYHPSYILRGGCKYDQWKRSFDLVTRTLQKLEAIGDLNDS